MGEPEGFRDFVAARSPALLRTAWLLTGDWARAEDLVQTALAKVWPRWDTIHRSDDPEVYVRRVLVTTQATWWRRHWRAEVPTALIPDAATAHDAYEQAETRAAVLHALRQLPRRQRAVIVLRFYEDLTETQTARVLDCSVGTVKSQTAKALTKLRAQPGLSPVTDAEVAP
ncbi:MAG TPA: SigE family RNA polymerase sigma factor [Mycobacteriales bacterium]|nr:SigE family RNA polymerase sigma factor [Mycobacteriales bacterium]